MLTTEKALAERERLRAEAKRASSTSQENADRAAELRHELDAIDRRRDLAIQAAARTGEPDELEKVNADEKRLQAELRDAETRAGAAGTARQAATRELVDLHRREYEAFAGHARELSATAAGLRDELRDAYVALYRAWEAARAEWNLLATDLGVKGAPRGLPQPADVFRPPVPAIEDTRAGAAEARTYYHADGRTMGITVGTPLHHVLATSDDWHLLEDGQRPPKAPPAGPNREVVRYRHDDGRILGVYVDNEEMREVLDSEDEWQLLQDDGELVIDVEGATR